MKYVIMTVTAAALLSSCGLYKSYERPAELEVDSLYNIQRTPEELSENVELPSWREVFTDPQLQAYIEKGLANNTDMQSAQLQIEQAEASLMAAKWAYVPSFAFAPQGSLSSIDWNKPSKTYSIPVSASWQVDIFGSLRNAKRRAKAQVINSQAYKDAVQTQLISAIANYYYTLAMLNDQLIISRKTEENWKENVEMMKALMKAGQSNMAAVSQTEATYYNVCTQCQDLSDQIITLNQEFSTLLGEVPTTHSVGSLSNWQEPYLDRNIRAFDLANRPDVKSAEAQLAAAFYATNESRAAFYPMLNLSGLLGWTNDLGTVVNPGKWIWNATAALTQPLLQNGKLRAQLKISKAQQEQARLTFLQTLLDAGAEVNTAMIKFQNARTKNKLYEKQIASLETAVKSTKSLMMNSSTTYLEVLTAEQTLLSAELAKIDNDFTQIQAIIELYQALGGGTK